MNPDSIYEAGYRIADTGLGTTYERFALNRALLRLHDELNFHDILEGPGDGMTGIPGINSLILGLRQVQVSLALLDADQARITQQVWRRYLGGDQNPNVIEVAGGQLENVPTASFDLVWNFNIISRHPTPIDLLDQMRRVSRRWVLFFCLNSGNYSFPIHQAHHRVARAEWDHGPLEMLRPHRWEQICKEHGLRVKGVLYVDCPWWPDIVDFGQLIGDFLPFMRGFARRAKPENRFLWPADHLPYYDLATHPQMAKQLERLALFEKSSLPWVKRTFAHHFGILAEKA